jgi:hypothetical protein
VQAYFFARQVAAIDAESRIRFYFWQRLLQLNLVSALHRVSTPSFNMTLQFFNINDFLSRRKKEMKYSLTYCFGDASSPSQSLPLIANL